MHVFFCSPFVATAEPAAQPISVQTALLIILGIALVFAFSSLARLHRKVDALHAARAPRRQTTPAGMTHPNPMRAGPTKPPCPPRKMGA